MSPSTHSAPEIETAVLCACFYDLAAATYALDRVRPEHFEGGAERQLLRAVQLVAAEGAVPDPALTANQLVDLGVPMPSAINLIGKVTAAQAIPSNQPYYVKALLTRYIERLEMDVAQDIARNGHTAAEQEALRHKVDRARAEVAKALAPKASSESWDLAVTFLDPEPPPPNLFVDRLFVRPSLNIVFGPPQAGKSWAVMALLLDLVTGGGNFMGSDDLHIFALNSLRDEREDNVLWIFGNEDTEPRVRRRLRKLLNGREIKEGRFTYATPPAGMSLNSLVGWKWLEDLIVEKKITALALDTIASLTGHTLDVNKAEQVVPFMQHLLDLRTRFQLVIFAMHHTAKAGKDAQKGIVAKADSMLGSQAFRSLAEGVLMLNAIDGDTSNVDVRSIKAKDIESQIPPFRACLETDTCRFRVLYEDETPPERTRVKPGKKSLCTVENILKLRADHPTGIRWADVRAAIGVTEEKTWYNNSSRLQSELLKLNHVVIDGVLKWAS